MNIFVSVVLTLFAVQIDLIYCKGFRCDYTYHASANGWFKLHLDPELYHEAKFICKSEGSVLASAAKSWVRDIMLKILIANTTVDNVFTQLDDVDTGKPINAFFRTDTVSVVGNSIARQFICYHEGSATVALSDCGTVDNEYQMYPNTQHCYKYHSTARTWGWALRTCRYEGGHLAVANSVDEATHLTEAQYGWTDKIFMGISANQAGEWTTVTGERVSASGFPFGPGQPVNAVGDNVCGALGHDVKLYNEPCSVPKQFFCEKDPNSLLCDPPTTTSTTTTTPRPPPPPPVYYPPPPPPPVYYPPPPPPPRMYYPPPPPPPVYQQPMQHQVRVSSQDRLNVGFYHVLFLFISFLLCLLF